MFSVNTNAGALKSLQNLNTTSGLLDRTQGRVNTGLKVASSKDNAAVFAIAQTMRGNLAGLSAVQNSLDRAMSTLDVAIAGAEAISDLLIEMKEKAVAAKDPGLDADSRTSLSDDFVQLRDQIESIARNASFNGTNLLTGDSLAAITDESGTSANTITGTFAELTLSALSLNETNLTTIPATSVSGTVESLAGQNLFANSDSDFLAALVNLENANGGNLGGENINTGTFATSNNDGQAFDTDYVDAVFAALGVSNQYDSAKLDGFSPFEIDFSASSTIHLVRDGASSYLVNGDPTAGAGSADSPEAAGNALTKIETAIDTVNTALSKLGSTAKRLEIQKGFTTKLSDGIDVGIGNLVDADLAKESALLQAFQTKQQLGLQALGIANQAPQSVLSLFS